jgi:hypothetical protein
MGAEGASAQGETTSTAPNSQGHGVVPSNASIEHVLQQRSPVFAPESRPGSPVGETSEELPRNAQQEQPQHSVDVANSLDEPVAPTAHTLGLNPAEQEQDHEFYEVETFAETRTKSPGLTYNDDDWGTSHRSPVDTPES